MTVPVEDVKKLRQRTGAGVLDCKRALQAAGGDMEEAVEHLREQGLSQAEQRRGRETREGIIGSYIHSDRSIGVLVEVNCESDFVARNQQFREFVHNIAMHIAAANPAYLDRESVPEEVIEGERDLLRRQAQAEGQPEQAVKQIVTGRLNKFYEENCLLEQPFVRDTDKTVAEYVKEHIATIGENIRVERFVRYQLGGEGQE